jgi:hypothetical protein
MAITFKLLATGVLPAADAALYTAPALTQAAIKQIRLYNKTAGTVTFTLTVKPSAGTARDFDIIALKAGYTRYISDLETLGAGDAIRGSDGNGAAIDYSIHGIERT